jgi:hypothetical protein
MYELDARENKLPSCTFLNVPLGRKLPVVFSIHMRSQGCGPWTATRLEKDESDGVDEDLTKRESTPLADERSITEPAKGLHFIFIFHVKLPLQVPDLNRRSNFYCAPCLPFLSLHVGSARRGVLCAKMYRRKTTAGIILSNPQRT